MRAATAATVMSRRGGSVPERLALETTGQCVGDQPRDLLDGTVVKQSSSEGYASRSAASSQGGATTPEDQPPTVIGAQLDGSEASDASLKRLSDRIFASRPRHGAAAAFSCSLPGTSRPLSACGAGQSARGLQRRRRQRSPASEDDDSAEEHRDHRRRHSALCQRCWSSLSGTNQASRTNSASGTHRTPAPVRYELAGASGPAQVDFDVGAAEIVDLNDHNNSNNNNNSSSNNNNMTVKSSPYGEVVAAARRSGALARRSERLRARGRALEAIRRSATDTDGEPDADEDDDDDGAVVIDHDDLPAEVDNACAEQSASTSASTLLRDPPASHCTLGDSRDLTQMRELMRRNGYVPQAQLAAASDEKRPFVRNRRSGNAVTLPSRVGYVPVPNTERLKVIVVGKSGVGKTTIVFSHRYNRQSVDAGAAYGATIGAAYFNLDLRVNGIPLYLQVWDTAGQERFRCMVPMYVRNASAAVVIYDITDRSSFDEIDRYVAEIKRTQSSGHEPSLILVGNKCDLDSTREVASGEGQAKATKLNAAFFEVTATNTTMVTALLAHIAERIYDTDSELMARLAATYRDKDGTGHGLRVLKKGDNSFLDKCCIIN